MLPLHALCSHVSGVCVWLCVCVRWDVTPLEQLVLDVAKIIREDFLQQNAFSSHDFNCPLPKSVRAGRAIALRLCCCAFTSVTCLALPQLGMLRCIMQLYDQCQSLLAEVEAEGDASEELTWASLKASLGSTMHKVTRTQYFVRPRAASVLCPGARAVAHRVAPPRIPFAQDPRSPADETKRFFEEVSEEISAAFDTVRTDLGRA